jgi:FG-GAP repeat
MRCSGGLALLLGALVGAAVALACVVPTATHGEAAVRTAGSREGIESLPAAARSFVQQAELTASHGTRGEELGESVAISGSTIVVGTPNYATSSGVEQGAVYVFTKPASGWANATQVAVLTARRGQPEELFGHSVSVSGSTIVVGAPFREVGKHTGQGAAYVFVRPAGGWRDATQTATLTAAKGEAHEFFGEAVAVSGNVVVSGAPSRAVGPNARQGAVDVFRKPAAGWKGAMTQSAQLTASDGRANDALGISVALSGRTIVAGADLHSVDARAGEGAAYVFVRPASGWRDATQTTELTAEEGGPGELFGHSVALSGATVAVGAPYREVGGVAAQGAVYVFVRPASGWSGPVGQAAELTASDGAKNELLGRSLAVSGNTVVAGASSREIARNAEQGELYVFAKSASGWANVAPVAELTAADGATGDSLGRSVAVSGDTVIAAAPDHEVRHALAQGAVYVFMARPPSAAAQAVH